jgi:hypothetical protein
MHIYTKKTWIINGFHVYIWFCHCLKYMPQTKSCQREVQSSMKKQHEPANQAGQKNPRPNTEPEQTEPEPEQTENSVLGL